VERIGPYAIVEELARGAQGVVYRARGADGTPVALKLMTAQRAANPSALKRFSTETTVLARLRHPNVVSILGAGEHEGRPWLAMELIQGESLAARLSGGPLPPWRARRVAQQLAQALSYVHACGVLHRDLKPENVLLEGDRALLTDFGLSRDHDTSLSRLTASGIFLGTPGYWAPEQARGERELDARTDVYGLGAVLYACLTGAPPVEGESLQQLLELERYEAIEPPRARRPEVPAWLSELCLRCLRVDPAQRPPTADAVARALVLGEDGAEPAARGKPLLAGAAALALLGLGGLLTTLALRGRSPAPPAAVAAVDSAPPASRDPEASRAHFARGREHETDDRIDDAIADYREATQLDPDFVAAWYRLGYLLRDEGRYAEAIPVLDRLLEVDPEHAKGYRQRGVCQAQLGNLEAAMADYTRAVEADPQYALGYLIRAQAHERAGYLQDAVADFSRVIELEPDNVAAHYGLGYALRRLERHQEAIAALDRAIELEPTRGKYYRNRALSKDALDHPAEEVLADFRQAIAVEPDYALGHWSLGRALLERGDALTALSELERSLELDPKHAGGHLWHARALAKLERRDEAREALARARELDPDNDEIERFAEELSAEGTRPAR